MKRCALPLLISCALLAACASKPKPQIAPPMLASGYPTQTRVEYVLQCMQEHGGQNYDTLYHCVCAIDKIAAKLTPDEFDQAQAFTYLYSTPGERGGEFRDPPQSKKLRDQLKEAKAEAAACFPNAGPTAKTP